MMSGPIIGIVITVVVLLAVIPSVWWAIKLVGGLHKQAAEEQRLLATGVPAQGQIISVGQTGTYVNNQPQVHIVLQVFPPNGQPYQVQLTKIVSIMQIPQFQPGAPVSVRIDPANPMNVAIAPGPPMMMAAPTPYGQPPQPPYPGY